VTTAGPVPLELGRARREAADEGADPDVRFLPIPINKAIR